MNTQMLPQMMIAPNKILIDNSYQRKLKSRRLAAMGEANMSRIGVLLVSVRANGDVYAIDGQTRRALLIGAGLGDVPIPAQYYTGLTVAEEAKIFSETNENGEGGRLPVNAWDKFHAGITGLDPEAVGIASIVEGLGLRISNSIKYGISAVEALGVAHANGNLKKTLETLQLWCPEGGKVYENGVIRAVSAFYAVYPKADKKRLSKALAPFSPVVVSQRIMRNKIVYGSPSLAKVGVLREIYNKGAKTSEKLE